MRRIEAILHRTPTTASFGILAATSVVLVVFKLFTEYFTTLNPGFVLGFEFAFQLGLLAAFGVAYLAWVSLHAFGRVGAGTGAGFRLAAVGLAARVWVAFLVMAVGGETSGSIYDEVPSVADRVWWVRNGSLVVYGCGIALVVIASVTDLVRRRRVPPWMTLVD
jgi:hypothetical protein